jgi:hypothetical protein
MRIGLSREQTQRSENLRVRLRIVPEHSQEQGPRHPKWLHQQMLGRNWIPTWISHFCQSIGTVVDICRAHLRALAKLVHCRKGSSRAPRSKATTPIYWVPQRAQSCGPAAIAYNKIASNDVRCAEDRPTKCQVEEKEFVCKAEERVEMWH